MTHNTEKKMKRGKQEKYAVLSIADMKAMIKMAESGNVSPSIGDKRCIVVYFEAAGPKHPGQLRFTQGFYEEWRVHRFPETWGNEEAEA